MPNSQLSENQKRFLDETIERRMKNTGETREQAAQHITNFLLTYTKDVQNSDGSNKTGTD